MYFKNRRVRRDRQRPDVAIRTNKLITVKLDENRSKKVANLWGLPNFAPERPAGEDDTSIEVNYSIIFLFQLHHIIL